MPSDCHLRMMPPFPCNEDTALAAFGMLPTFQQYDPLADVDEPHALSSCLPLQLLLLLCSLRTETSRAPLSQLQGVLSGAMG
jgi:hypothetical protein